MPSIRHWILFYLIVLIAVLTQLYEGGRVSRRFPESNNSLAARPSAPSEYSVALAPPLELDGMTRAEIFELREKAVARDDGLVAAPYAPSPAVFGEIEDRLPWYGMLGRFVFGYGSRVAEGPSEESRFILNPFVLLAPDFEVGFYAYGMNGWRDVGEVERAVLSGDLQLSPQFSRLEYSGDRRSATLRVELSRFIEQANPYTKDPLTLENMYFFLVTYNARDLGFRAAAIDFERSQNIFQPKNAYQGAFQLVHYLHRGGSCGQKGGCNNMSPASPYTDVHFVTALPAQMVVKLWRDIESAKRDEPFVYRMVFQ